MQPVPISADSAGYCRNVGNYVGSDMPIVGGQL